MRSVPAPSISPGAGSLLLPRCKPSLPPFYPQAAYLVGVSDPNSQAGQQGLVDPTQFARANQAIQMACQNLVDPACTQSQVGVRLGTTTAVFLPQRRCWKAGRCCGSCLTLLSSPGAVSSHHRGQAHLGPVQHVPPGLLPHRQPRGQAPVRAVGQGGGQQHGQPGEDHQGVLGLGWQWPAPQSWDLGCAEGWVANCWISPPRQALDGAFNEENRERCRAATAPLIEAVDNLTAFASNPEFATVPAQISPEVGCRRGREGVAWLWWALRQGGVGRSLKWVPRAEMVSGGCDEEAALSIGHRGAAPG